MSILRALLVLCILIATILTGCSKPTPAPTSLPVTTAVSIQPQSTSAPPIQLPGVDAQSAQVAAHAATMPSEPELGGLPGLVQGPATGSDAGVTDLGPNLVIHQHSERCATLGEDGQTFSLPARIQTYSWYRVSLNLKYETVLLRDSARADLMERDQEADDAQYFAGIADEYFRRLAAKGVGIWDGCYGQTREPIMTSLIHIPADKLKTAGWQTEGSMMADAVAYNDKYLKQDVAVHEWTHGLVSRTLSMHTEGGPDGQTGALAESLSDTFAVLQRGDGTYTIGTGDGTFRRLDKPEIDHYDKLIKNGDKNTKYANSGIPGKAAYLIIEALRKEKAELIYFHALNPEFMKAAAGPGQYSFEEFARGVVVACADLATRRIGGVSADNCVEARKAFQTVGMLKASTTAPQRSSSAGEWPGKIAYTRSQDGINGIWVIDGTGKTMNLTHGAQRAARPRWSPDGKRLMFSLYSAQEGRYQTWMMNDDGSDQHQILAGIETYYTPEWSHDGALMVFNYENAIWVADGNGNNPVRLTSAEDIGPNSGEFARDWFPDDNRMLFEKYVLGSRQEIWVMNADGSGKRQVSAADYHAFNMGSRLSLDGKRIAFFVRYGGDYTQVLMVMNADGSGTEQLMPAVKDGREKNLVWSPDGKYLLFTQNMHVDASPGNKFGLFVVELATKQVTLKTDRVNSISQPVWSPDGSFIAYTEGPNLCTRRSDSLEGNSGKCYEAAGDVDPAWTPR